MNYNTFQANVGFHDAIIGAFDVSKTPTGWIVNMGIEVNGVKYKVDFGYIDYVMVCGLGMIANEVSISDIDHQVLPEDMKRDLRIPNNGFVSRIEFGSGSTAMIVSNSLNIVKCS